MTGHPDVLSVALRGVRLTAALYYRVSTSSPSPTIFWCLSPPSAGRWLRLARVARSRLTLNVSGRGRVFDEPIRSRFVLDMGSDAARQRAVYLLRVHPAVESEAAPRCRPRRGTHHRRAVTPTHRATTRGAAPCLLRNSAPRRLVTSQLRTNERAPWWRLQRRSTSVNDPASSRRRDDRGVTPIDRTAW